MEFVHNVVNYDGQTISSWKDRNQAERECDEDDWVVSEVVGRWEPREAYREVVRCYYDGAAVDPVSELRIIHRHEVWDVETAAFTVEHNIFAEDGRRYAEITVDAWDRFDAMEVTIEVARDLRPPPDGDGPVQGPPSPVEWCDLLSKEGWAKGWVHTGPAVDVYNTGRRHFGDYAGGQRWNGLVVVPGDPVPGFFDWEAERMKVQISQAKQQGDRDDIVQFIVLVVLLCACGYLAVQLIAWAL